MSKSRKQGSRDAARPDNKVNVFEEVGALIKERRKYADWIAALEAKREQTAEAVYARVHLDYESRLKAVVDQLGEHRETLTEEQETLRKKLADLDGQIEEYQDERAETEIRAQVGELSAAALTEALRDVDTELERLEDKRATVETNLAKIDDFFAAVDGTGSRPARTSSPKRRGGFDEMSFLNSVVGQPNSEATPERTGEINVQRAPEPKVEAKPEPSPEPKPEPRPEPKPEPKVEPPPQPSPPPKPVEVPTAPPVQPPAPPSMSAEKPAAAAQADGVVEKATELEAPPPPRPIPRQSIAMTMAALTLEGGAKAQSDLGIIKTGDELPPSILDDLTPGSGAKPLAANVASNNPLTLKGSATPNELKSLKCKECGTMNDPSEWYCERCGAELSAI